ncbi:MAG: pseudouridine synthase [Cellulosilyticaceae bacterium]
MTEKKMLEKKMRLDRYLVHVGYGSRSIVQKIIKQKRVQVDDQVINKPEYGVVVGKQTVKINGEVVVYKEFYHFIMNKPGDVITATRDNVHTTVVDLLDEMDQNKEVAPVGRLDKDTEGLLLLTNDGKLTHSLLSPKKHVDKVYYAKVAGKVTEEDVVAFSKGIELGDGTMCMPAKLEILTAGEESEVHITIKEGKFHQVKRMIANCGKEVTYLQRIKMGGFSLPEDLELGCYRELTEKELRLLKEDDSE